MINMNKGDAPVSLTKTAGVTARMTWSSHTDYDLYAIVVRTNGDVEYVATFGARGVPARMSTADGAVKHLGDVGRGAQGIAEETIEIKLNDSIRAVVPVAYSAQSNGPGSFYRYGVTLEIDNGAAGDRVMIAAENANPDDKVYSCVPGMIENAQDSVVIHALEQYSGRGSENRPTVKLRRSSLLRKGAETTEVVMDEGPRNNHK
ncbi:TerD family protein [Streptomyces lydicus]|uniref:TerD family protein n=1 Tax=Streptomyces lydicus TaxID=47763 RepID=UPI0010135CA4|nr:TerD family protein [Streptomyces lydicus]MCZ1012063.1 TerD family protein [Streptomyces lydicus]